MTITFQVQVSHLTICKACDGTGMRSGNTLMPQCIPCRGLGVFYRRAGLWRGQHRHSAWHLHHCEHCGKDWMCNAYGHPGYGRRAGAIPCSICDPSECPADPAVQPQEQRHKRRASKSKTPGKRYLACPLDRDELKKAFERALNDRR